MATYSYVRTRTPKERLRKGEVRAKPLLPIVQTAVSAYYMLYYHDELRKSTIFSVKMTGYLIARIVFLKLKYLYVLVMY